ncbi:MAG: hemerythrin family protein, partial [Magnetococcales bacterium]|nr:hemerythrin family protein [Magnetococcales bacterium]
VHNHKDDPILIGNIIDNLADFAFEHFSDEEALFKQHGYPGANQQHQSHTRFAAKVAQLQKRLKAGDTSVIQGLDTFLSEWLTGHILEEDMQYKSFFESRGIL